MVPLVGAHAAIGVLDTDSAFVFALAACAASCVSGCLDPQDSTEWCYLLESAVALFTLERLNYSVLDHPNTRKVPLRHLSNVGHNSGSERLSLGLILGCPYSRPMPNTHQIFRSACRL